MMTKQNNIIDFRKQDNRIARLALLFALGFCATNIARAARPDDVTSPHEGVFQEDWFIVELEGGKAGHAHSTISRDGDRIESVLNMTVAIKRMDVTMKIDVSQVTRELLDGTPVGFDNSVNLGGVPIRTRGKIKNGRVKLREEQAGKVTNSEYPFDASAKLGWGTYLEQHKHGWAPGVTYTITSYDASVRPDGPIFNDITVLGAEDIVVGGKKTNAMKVKMITRIPKGTAAEGDDDKADGGGAKTAAAGMLQSFGKLETHLWVDSKGNPLRTEMNMGAISFVLTKATESEATAKNDVPELFISTMIRAKGAVQPKSGRIVYRLSVTGDDELPDLPNTTMQRFERIDKQSGKLTVQRIDWSGLRTIRKNKITSAVEPFLKSTVYADCDNPKIQKLAAQAARDSRMPAEQADLLRKFVTDYITEKNLSVGFATATEVADSKEGDCSEHGVLLAALARAAGLPSRGVAGIVQVPGNSDPNPLFGYHMWTQVWINGDWVDIDGAMRQTDCDPTHIALATLDLNGNDLSAASMQFIPFMGRLRIEIESQSPSKNIRPKTRDGRD